MARLVITLLFISLIAGQLVRLPLPGQGGGLLLSDIAVVLVLLVALWRTRCLGGQFSIFKLFTPFIIWSAFTLVVHMPHLGWDYSVIAAAYWVRLTAYLLLLPALLLLLADQGRRKFAERAWLVTIALLVGLGFLQLLVVPNLHLPGWDPHQGRLVSTWLDPNLFGAFLALALLWLFPLLTKEGARRIGGGVVSILVVLALLLTRSRTSFLALGGAALLLSPFFITRYIRWAGFVLAALIVGILLLGERAGGLVTFDPTVVLRLESWQSAWQLIQEHPWLGVGYNAYQFAFEGDFTIHSRAGADNSWLTLWATTGLPGVLLFALPWLVIVGQLARRPALWALVALFVHSQFVNSFLYGHLLITLAIVCALELRTPGE